MSSLGVRTIIELNDDMIEELKTICDSTGESRTSVIREAVVEYLAKRRPQNLDSVFGLWKDDKRDALEIEDELRSEWGD